MQQVASIVLISYRNPALSTLSSIMCCLCSDVELTLLTDGSEVSVLIHLSCGHCLGTVNLTGKHRPTSLASTVPSILSCNVACKQLGKYDHSCEPGRSFTDDGMLTQQKVLHPPRGQNEQPMLIQATTSLRLLATDRISLMHANPAIVMR